MKSTPRAWPIVWAFLVLWTAGGVGTFPAPLSAAEPPHDERTERGLKLFQSDVRAVLAGRCVKCHGGEATESEFSLVDRQHLLQGGASGSAVDLEKPAESRLYKLIAGQLEPAMPQDGSPLSARETAAVLEWIGCGAPYSRPLVEKNDDPLAWIDRRIDPADRDWWAFRPLASGDPPTASEDDRWSQTPIDRFLRASQSAKGLTANPIADRRSLIRRATFDLIGLPPTAEEVEKFVSDPAPDAYEALIDRLLESPHYGERYARHWLDVARFAESHGFEQDYDRPYAYHYRDFVIQAFNADMPFDQFVQWQLAGDELAPEEPLALMATGFLGAGVFPTQITANEVERTRYDALDDMASTTGAAFLGLTIGCARCHDHKFDPVPQGDYYRLLATFTTTVRGEIDVQLDAAAHRQATAEFEKQLAPRRKARQDYEQGPLSASLASWESSEAAAFLAQPRWLNLDFVQTQSAGGAAFTRLPDGSLLIGGANPDFDTFTFTAEIDWSDFTSLRLEALAHESLVKSGPGRAENGNFALSDFRLTARTADGASIPISLSDPQATFEQSGLPVAAAVDGDKKTCWAVDPKFGENHAARFRISPQSPLAGRVSLQFVLDFQNNNKHALGRVRLSLASGDAAPDLAGESMPLAARAALGKPADQRTPQETSALLAWFAPRDSQWVLLDQEVREFEKQRPQPRMTKVMVSSEGITPIRHHTQGADFFEQTFYLERGDTERKQGPAPVGFLQALSRTDAPMERWPASPPAGARTSFRRAALASWITDTEYGPGELLARVIVNRLWRHHFGRGIVATCSDFGRQGARPSHPELLDWLAKRLIDGGWRLKPIHKLMMTSAAYMQSADHDASRAAIDPENELLWRYPMRRLEAEVIRDAMLAVSGSLDRTMFGPGSLDENHQRRSIYFTIKRSQLIPSMQLFDMPEPLVSVGERPSTTIAPQALAFMNSAQVRTCASLLAKKLIGQVADRHDRAAVVQAGYLATLGRQPDAKELAAACAFLEKQTASYQSDSRPDAHELALADLCQVWFGLNEFVYSP